MHNTTEILVLNRAGTTSMALQRCVTYTNILHLKSAAWKRRLKMS